MFCLWLTSVDNFFSLGSSHSSQDYCRFVTTYCIMLTLSMISLHCIWKDQHLCLPTKLPLPSTHPSLCFVKTWTVFISDTEVTGRVLQEMPVTDHRYLIVSACHQCCFFPCHRTQPVVIAGLAGDVPSHHALRCRVHTSFNPQLALEMSAWISLETDHWTNITKSPVIQ